MEIRRCLVLAIFMGLMAWPGSGLAGDQISLARKISFAKGITVAETILTTCALETRVPAEIAAAAPGVQLVGSTKGLKGRVLYVQISEVHALPGGAFSGPKALTIVGTLKKGEKVTGTFRARRLAAKPAGTCEMLGNSATALGKDVASWLKAPTFDASLGDAR